MKILSLFRNDTKRLLKDVGVIISLLLMPLVGKWGRSCRP